MLYNDDCLYVLREFQEQSIDMIYLDPPFFTQKIQRLRDAQGKTYEFSDIWHSKAVYLQFVRTRLLEMRRVLTNDGSIFFHCGRSASYDIKVLLDEVFGEVNFRSEIIWSYKRWSNAQRGLLPNHQTIFFYSKTKHYKFNTLFCEYSPTTNVDQILQMRERVGGKTVYKMKSNGEIVLGKAKKGVPLSDVWEIPFLNPKAKERTGYPTQKPIELLDRIIKISTNEGDIVLDPFCGSGTTLVSAKLLNRRYIGIDINKEAIKLTQQRLEKPYKTSSHLLSVGKDCYMTKTSEELAILHQFDCDIVHRNKGIDAFLRQYYNNRPVAIKIHRETETFEEAVQLLDNAGKRKQCSYTVLISNQQGNTPENMVVLRPLAMQLHQLLY